MSEPFSLSASEFIGAVAAANATAKQYAALLGSSGSATAYVAPTVPAVEDDNKAAIKPDELLSFIAEIADGEALSMGSFGKTMSATQVQGLEAAWNTIVLQTLPSEVAMAAWIKRNLPDRPMSADEIVAGVAAVLAAKAFLAGNKQPAITGAMVEKALAAATVATATTKTTSTIAPATLAAAISFALGKSAGQVIANATAVAACVLRSKIAMHAAAAPARAIAATPPKPVTSPGLQLAPERLLPPVRPKTPPRPPGVRGPSLV